MILSSSERSILESSSFTRESYKSTLALSSCMYSETVEKASFAAAEKADWVRSFFFWHERKRN